MPGSSSPFIPPVALLLFSLGVAGCQATEGPVPLTGDVPAAPDWRAEVVVEGLEHPWAMVWLPDGTILVSERPGRLRLIREGRLLPRPVPGLPEVLALGQGGLLDLALHPRFADNQWLYLVHAVGSERANRLRLSRGRFDGERLREVTTLFEVADPKTGGQHFGARILWLPDESLLLSVGDGGNPPIAFAGANIRDQAQNLGTHFGKVLRLTADGEPHPENPFTGRPDARPEIFSYGHRNIQGLALDPRTGTIWANEHGARGGDELNLLRPGANYGWPDVTYSNEYWGPAVSGIQQRDDVQSPHIVWTPSKAPSGLAVYMGDYYPGWQGSLFSGALKFGEVRRIRVAGDRILGEEKLTIGRRVRDVREGPDGRLYVLTDEPNGALLRLEPARPTNPL